ncbi:hypothetical protein [Zhaonella formicivorans]|uniref:hypothetical protein n=1 Tax=Zhaonella formicivorans TaxID=2528593 RepID=UPI001D12941E|nr:hypothetical protein [Zhaonella formicivorans]
MNKKNKFKYNIRKNKVFNMLGLTKKISREDRLHQAKMLSDSISAKTVSANLTYPQIKKDVQAAYQDVKSNRSSSNN